MSPSKNLGMNDSLILSSDRINKIFTGDKTAALNFNAKEQVVNNYSGSNKEEDSLDMTLYPNPLQGIFWLTGREKPLKVEIMDAAGKLLVEKVNPTLANL